MGTYSKQKQMIHLEEGFCVSSECSLKVQKTKVIWYGYISSPSDKSCCNDNGRQVFAH